MKGDTEISVTENGPVSSHSGVVDKEDHDGSLERCCAAVQYSVRSQNSRVGLLLHERTGDEGNLTVCHGGRMMENACCCEDAVDGPTTSQRTGDEGNLTMCHGGRTMENACCCEDAVDGPTTSQRTGDEGNLTVCHGGRTMEHECCCEDAVDGLTTSQRSSPLLRRRRSWCKKKKVSTGFAPMCGAAVGVVFATALTWGVWQAMHHNLMGVCDKPACVLAAARMLQRMDSTADPCVDFYQFSCGNYLRSQEVPDANFHRSMLQEMQEEVLAVIKKLIEQPPVANENEAIKKARTLYASCMDRNFRTSHYKQYEDLPVFGLLSTGELGPWPLLRLAPWNRDTFQLHRLMGELAVFQVHTLLEMYVTPDEKNASQYTLQFYKGQPAIETMYYLNASHPDYTRYLRSYRRLLRESVLLLTQGNQDSLHDAEDILDFESKFANVTEGTKCFSLSTNGTDDDQETGRMSLEELQEAAPELDWMSMLNHTLSRLGVELPVPLAELSITFRCRAFLPELKKLLEATDSRTVTNYLIWRFLFKFMPYLGNKFLQIWIEFRKDVPDNNEDKLYLSRWKQCANIVNEGLGLAVGHLYINSPYYEIVENKTLMLIKYLKAAFREVIGQEDWLKPREKKEVIDKVLPLPLLLNSTKHGVLDSMGSKVGYPKYIEDAAALAAEYDDLTLSDKNFLQNMLTLKKHEVWKELRKLARPVDKAKEWLIQPLVVNAFNNPTTNEIILPLGILRHPMFNLDYPMYLNFANIGIVIGHEMTHGFDNHGKRYDKNGNTSNWFTEEMTARFRERAVCFTEQYSEFPLEMVDKNVDGNETLGDNICDNAGLHHSWVAYQTWREEHGPEPGLPGLPYTVDQMFFVTYGQIWCEVMNKEGYEQYTRDVHSPGRYRTLGVLQNNRDFADTFSCPPGSPMNPSRKCHLWS